MKKIDVLFKQLFLSKCDNKGEMANRSTYYDILRVSRDAEMEVIHASYRTLMATLKKHPDLGGDVREAALINEAYEVLSDPAKRAVYDAGIGLTTVSSRAGNKPPAERRRASRKRLDTAVSFSVNHDTRWHSARVVDISILGMRLKSHLALAVGEHMVIVPPNLAASAIHGTVKWARMFHPSVFERVYEAGIEFSDQIADIEQRFEI